MRKTINFISNIYNISAKGSGTSLLTLSAVMLSLFIFPVNTRGQVSPASYSYPYNHLKWYTVESPHFLVHFQKGNSRSAKVVSRIAEEVYSPITELYHHKPDSKVSIVLRDREDYSNGAAYFFDNKIDIWVPPLQTQLRGTHDWMHNVIAHEFTHIVQLQASLKRDRSIPAIYFQWLSYEDVRRPDVLYGYPKGIISHPFASVSIPAWFAEGTAQYQRKYLSFDTWDSHRDMILRTSLLSNTYLGYTEMGDFSSKTSLQHEKVYNQGFAFTSWLADKFGEQVLASLSQTSAKTNEHNFNKIIRRVTGKKGEFLFSKFIKQQKKRYRQAVSDISPTPSKTVEGKGFYNFYPTFRPGTDTIAYLSNRREYSSFISLYVKPLSDSSRKAAKKVAEIRKIPTSNQGFHQRRFGSRPEPLIDFISTSFSFSPKGKQLIYTTISPNKYGEEYRDLYLYTFKKGKKRKLTRDQRVQDPAWGPSGKRIAVVRMHHGTQNLALYYLESDSIRTLTPYDAGEQVTRPSWSPDGSSIYYSYSDSSRRSIRKYNLKTGEITTVLQKNGVDYRDAHVGPKGNYLYYAADPDGIFNIYRKPIGESGQQQLTSVIGGAFMPAVDAQGRLVYAEYRSGGYKIVRSNLDSLLKHPHKGEYNFQQVINDKKTTIRKPDLPRSSTGLTTRLNTYSADKIKPFDTHPFSIADTGRYNFELPTTGAKDQRSFYAHKEHFTDFTFYPVIRFDNYSKLHGSNGKLLTSAQFGKLGRNLIRDFKAGFYFSSFEVTGQLSIFGGALFGLGSREAEGINDFFAPSRLVDLDRDLFLQIEYEGLPFIERYWSPTVSIELFNLKRNVQNGISIEEFPCTSCLPDTTTTDVTYSVWEANLYLRSKLSKHSMLELGLRYSPYRATTEGFVSRQLDQFVPGTTSEYYKSTRLSAAYSFEWMRRYMHSDIAPIGIKGYTEYAYEPARLLKKYELAEGTLSPIYETSHNHTFKLKTRYGFPLWGKTTGQIYSRFFTYMNPVYNQLGLSSIEQPEDYFYLDYIGGYTGMRSYPYFALGGYTTAFIQLSYHLPLITDINQQWGRYTFDKIFARLYAEAGNGWGGPLDIGKDIKTGVGAEMRFAFNSHYLFPLKLFISGSYGFDQFRVHLPNEFITTNQSSTVTYGRELLFHFGLTFDFEVLW